MIPVADIRAAADLLEDLGAVVMVETDVQWLRRKAKWGGGERYEKVADSIELMREEIDRLIKALQEANSLAKQFERSVGYVVREAIGIEDE